MLPGMMRGSVAGGAISTLVDRTTGTNIGNMTAQSGLAAAFDGTTSQAASVCAAISANPGYVGKTYSAGKAVDKIQVYGPNNGGYLNGIFTSTTLTLYAKNSLPANGTDGTSLGSTTFTNTADESTARTIAASDTITTYTNIWVYVDGGAGNSTYCAELVTYEML